MKALPHERSLADQYKNRPFAMIGFNMDDPDDFDGSLVECFKENKINFPNFVQTDDIVTDWGLQAGKYVLIDHRGVIRKIGVVAELHDKALEKEIEFLVQQAEKAGK